MQPVVHSLLETDLYKFTMWQAMLHRHPAAQRSTGSSAATSPGSRWVNCWTT